MSDVQPVAAGLFETATDQEALDKAVAAAAPAAVERADLAMVNTLEPALRGPMYALLVSLADNKYMLGRRYAEWCTGAPMLESAVAAAAMAQDELGHARSFYPLLRGFPNARGGEVLQMEDRGWQQRSTNAVACLDRSFLNWAEFLAANVLVDTAFTTLLSAALSSPYEPLRQRAAKIVQEEAGHWVHAAGWVRRLSISEPSRLAQALAQVWDDAFVWFGATDDTVIGPLAGAGILDDSPDALRARLRSRVAPILDEGRLAEPLLARELPWSHWDPSARRLRS